MAYDTKTYAAESGGHRIEFEFDKSGVIVNRGRLFIDGRQVDRKTVHYGESRVRGQLPDGRSVSVDFGSGFVGQLKSLRLEIDGAEVELHEQPG